LEINLETPADGAQCGRCVIPGCEGTIILHVDRRCMVSLGNMIIGPGGAGQWEDIISYACDKCCVAYCAPPIQRPRPQPQTEQTIA